MSITTLDERFHYRLPTAYAVFAHTINNDSNDGGCVYAAGV